jgi:gliding motility-associated-like protein
MNNPAGKEGQFTVTADGSPISVTAIQLKEGDPNTIQLTLASPLTGSEEVYVSYTQGDITATTGGMLLSFVDEPVTLLSQTINFPSITDKKYGDPDYTPGASASGGGIIEYASSNQAVATVVLHKLRFTGVGSSTITAIQQGNETYAPAVYSRPLTVLKGDQSITFDPLPAKTYGDADFSAGAISSSGLPVTLESSNTAVAIINGGLISITGAGTAIITASQPGNENYNPAVSVQQTLIVSKASQTIVFNPLPVVQYGDNDFTITATSTSGLTVTFSSSNTDVAVVSGNDVHITGGGSTEITALQPGNDNYSPAESVIQILNVTKVTLTVTAGNFTKPYLDPLPTLTFIITGFVKDETQAVIDVLPTAQTTATQNSDAGTYPVTLSGGDDNCYDFSFADGELTITPIAQVITFGALPESIFTGATFDLTATSTSGLTVSFESLSQAVATVSGNTLTGVTRGTANIRAYNDGNINYLPAEAFASIEITTTHRDVLYLFTPNNDGRNDLWEIPGKAEMGKCDVKVYNRWGKLVYANADYNNDWDGTSEGKPLPEGAYVFIIKSENQGVMKGTVNIVR